MKACCVWCLKVVKANDDYLTNLKKDVVCDKTCAENERRFRIYNANEMIGRRCYETHGVNVWELEKRLRRK